MFFTLFFFLPDVDAQKTKVGSGHVRLFIMMFKPSILPLLPLLSLFFFFSRPPYSPPCFASQIMGQAFTRSTMVQGGLTFKDWAVRHNVALRDVGNPELLNVLVPVNLRPVVHKPVLLKDRDYERIRIESDKKKKKKKHLQHINPPTLDTAQQGESTTPSIQSRAPITL